jgi:methyl-accepting chemotaxis protein
VLQKYEEKYYRFMKLKWKITLPILALLLLSTLLTTLLSFTMTKSTIDEITENILDGSLEMIIDEITRAERTENVVMNEINEKNITLAHSFSEKLFIMSQEGTLDLDDSDFFRDMAEMLGAIEVNVVDSERVIRGSNFDDYYEWQYSEDTVYTSILADSDFVVVEEPREDSISGEIKLYFGVARRDAPGFIQIGFDADAVKVFRQNLDIANVAAGMRVGLTGRASVIKDGVILYSKKEEIIGDDVTGTNWYRQMSDGRGRVWVDISGEQMYAGYANIDNGYTLLVMMPKDEYDGYLSSVNVIAAVGVGIALVIALIIVILLLIILKPIKAIEKASKAISSGDFDVSLRNKSKDEIGVLARNFDSMAETFKMYIDEINGVLASIADGDFTSRIDRQYVGQFESIRVSINTIENVLNSTMNDISSASGEVLSGSTQIASGSQALADGATQQASTVSQISDSIESISDKTHENAEKTQHASALANTIMRSAEKGSAQMEQMISAVNEINQANQNISKVIKAIDDIAFQTNILALNAAVEAARAGAAGKGFAVVAEEVRNLASKSALSAKDTASLIANSMEKAELGTRIAAETATSLKEIVDGINESNRIMSEIAVSSQSQNEAIDQINSAIHGVSRVVQQNSATAQQSAAASEVMSSQATVLEELVSKFNLRQ